MDIRQSVTSLELMTSFWIENPEIRAAKTAHVLLSVWRCLKFESLWVRVFECSKIGRPASSHRSAVRSASLRSVVIHLSALCRIRAWHPHKKDSGDPSSRG